MSSVTPPGGNARASFNLSEWALHHRSIVLYLIVVFALMGGLAYTQLGQSEDPPFTFKVMVVRTNWPGASTREVEQQVTDKIERKVQELPLEWVRSYSKPGESLVFVSFRDSLPPKAIAELQYQARKKIGDIRNTLPQGIQGPFFNDEFGDTYTNIYAITGDGFGYRELDDFADRIRAELLRVPGVAKVDKIAAQDEKIFIELSNSKLATLGVEPAQILQSLAAQNAVAAAGCVRDVDRSDLRAHIGDVRLGRRDPRFFDPREQPDLSPRRHRGRAPRLRRSAAAEDALAWPRGAGTGHHDGERRRRDRARKTPRAQRRRDRRRAPRRCRDRSRSPTCPRRCSGRSTSSCARSSRRSASCWRCRS